MAIAHPADRKRRALRIDGSVASLFSSQAVAYAVTHELSSLGATLDAHHIVEARLFGILLARSNTLIWPFGGACITP